MIQIFSLCILNGYPKVSEEEDDIPLASISNSATCMGILHDIMGEVSQLTSSTFSVCIDIVYFLSLVYFSIDFTTEENTSFKM